MSLGWTIKNSAIAIGLNYDYAQEIIRNYNKSGEKTLRNGHKNPKKRSRGKKPLLSKEQIEKLKQELESLPSPEDGIWTGPKVARWIEKETGIEKVWNQRGWDYLKKLKYSCQSPRPSHKKGDKLEQEIFKANLPLVVKKLEQENPGIQVDTWFFDEHRVGLKPIIKKVWSKIGIRPKAIVSYGYEWLYVYGFVKPKTGENLWYLIPRVNTKWLNVVYKNFAIDANVSEKKKVLLVEDNAGWHSSKKVEVPAGITIAFLPPYSPELQPAERLWQLVDEPLVNQNFETIDEIEEILIKRCNVLNNMKKEVKDLTNYHWLNNG